MNGHQVSMEPISGIVYKLLWFTAIVGTFTAYNDLSSQNDLGGISNTLVFCFALISSIHQGMIYLDLHRMDLSPQSYTGKFINWFGTANERRLRMLIFIALLFGVGKVASAVDPICGYLGSVSMGYSASIASAAATFSTFLRATDKVFVLGSIVLFAALLLWNAIALARRINATGSAAPARSIEALINAVMSGAFALLASIGLAYWLLVFNQSAALTLFSQMLIVSYTIIAGVAFLLRSDRFSSYLAGRIRGFFDGGQNEE